MSAKEKESDRKSRKRARVTVAHSLWDEYCTRVDGGGFSHQSFAPDN